MNAFILRLLIFLVLVAPTALAVTIETVPVGDVGNPGDPYWGDEGVGSVNYAYRIGTYEVMNSQYAEFLNAKAKSDPFELYSPDMGSSLFGGIARSGVNGSFSYAVKPNMGDKPVNFVNLWDAERFVNWLHNGQGDGDTETGSYTLLGGAHPTNHPARHTRTANATWVIPIESEWYKAAYYDPRTEAEGGPPGDGHYWLIATGSNDLPTLATADPVGNINNPGSNVANYGGANWNGSTFGNVTTVGSAGPQSRSYYGTFDQSGNVGEWTYLPVGQPWELLGGEWSDLTRVFPFLLTGQARFFASSSAIGPSFAHEGLGFRVAYVPEPSSLVLAALALLALIVGRNRLEPLNQPKG